MTLSTISPMFKANLNSTPTSVPMTQSGMTTGEVGTINDTRRFYQKKRYFITAGVAKILAWTGFALAMTHPWSKGSDSGSTPSPVTFKADGYGYYPSGQVAYACDLHQNGTFNALSPDRQYLTTYTGANITPEGLFKNPGGDVRGGQVGDYFYPGDALATLNPLSLREGAQPIVNLTKQGKDTLAMTGNYSRIFTAFYAATDFPPDRALTVQEKAALSGCLAVSDDVLHKVNRTKRNTVDSSKPKRQSSKKDSGLNSIAGKKKVIAARTKKASFRFKA